VFTPSIWVKNTCDVPNPFWPTFVPVKFTAEPADRTKFAMFNTLGATFPVHGVTVTVC
jgi:hypothetical protein